MEYVFSDVNEAFPVMWHRMLSRDGMTERISRNGRVIESTTPVTTIFMHPERRVLFHPVRDANPFFHLFEAIWMLAGWNDVSFLAKFNPRMADYSDDGVAITGSAYGYKWRQVLLRVVNMIRNDNSTRRAYIPLSDFEEVAQDTKDTPCNVGISFHIRDGYLDMTVFNRSNDMIWGAYGANYVHFGFFQEFVAALTNLKIGTYSQISSCFHLYTEFDITKKLMGNVDPAPDNPYEYIADLMAEYMPILNNVDHGRESWGLGDDDWQRDAAQFRTYTQGNFYQTRPWRWNDPFFSHVAVPMYRGWRVWKDTESVTGALDEMQGVQMYDWRKAGMEWIHRRHLAREAKKAA